MRKSILAAAMLGLIFDCMPTQAAMREVMIENNGSRPIYRLYGWPSALVPRTFNLLSLPLPPGQRKAVQVEDVYDSCVFSFQADYNNPRRTLRRVRVRQRYISLAYKGEINLCQNPTPGVGFR